MRVLRVEGSDGHRKGPYNSGTCVLPYGTWNTHPTPDYDKGIERTICTTEFCGFVSLAQLLAWFSGYFSSLASEQFCVAVYEIPDEDVTVGERQCVFVRRDAMPRKLIPARSFAFADDAINP